MGDDQVLKMLDDKLIALRLFPRDRDDMRDKVRDRFMEPNNRYRDPGK